jgi:hypothetical protein
VWYKVGRAQQMEEVMTLSPDTKLTRINRMLREIGGINQEIKAEAAQDAERRAMLTVWVQTASSKELSAVIHLLETTRF